MIKTNPPQSGTPRVLTGRRIVLMASVAAIGAALLVAGPFNSGFGGSGGNAFGTRTASAADSTLQHPAGFSDIVAKVKPAVISVRVKIPAAADPALAQQMGDDDEQQIPAQPGSPLDKFLQQFGNQFGRQFGDNAPQPHDAPHGTIVGEGSGFFISPDGYAVTNNHVVDHAKSVQVTTDDGTIYTAKVIGTDPKTDLAVIKVDGKNDFPVREIRRPGAESRRLGGRRRQSVRPRRHRDGGHRFRARPRHRRRTLRRLHPDRRADQQG